MATKKRSSKKKRPKKDKKSSQKSKKDSKKQQKEQKSKSSRDSKSKSSKGLSARINVTKIGLNVLIWGVIFCISLVVVDFGVQYLNYNASVAIVNGERVSRSDYIEKLENSYGTAIVDQLIDEALIYQEAEEQDVSVSQDEIEKEIKTLEESYGGKEALEKELKDKNITREQLEEQVETTILVQKMLDEDIEITEEEKKEFFEQYKEMLFPENPDPTYEESEEKIEEILKEQKLGSKVQPWLAELEEEATLENNIEDPKSYGLLKVTREFIKDLID